MAKCIEMTIAWVLPDDFDHSRDWRDHPAFDRIADAAHDVEGFGDVHVVAGLVDKDEWDHLDDEPVE